MTNKQPIHMHVLGMIDWGDFTTVDNGLTVGIKYNAPMFSCLNMIPSLDAARLDLLSVSSQFSLSFSLLFFVLLD